jgi:methylglutaconyl-CoA hydratase
MITTFNYIELLVHESFAEVKLARPEVRNAFHGEMIDELHLAIQQLYNTKALKYVVLSGKGQHFCAGADLQWMKQAKSLSYDDNVRQTRKLYRLFKLWYELPIFTIVYVQGASVGGGNGLVAASDYVLAHPDAWFSFPEVKLGLVPATIAPFVLKRLPQAVAKQWLLSASAINADVAMQKGWVDKLMHETAFATYVDELALELARHDSNAMSKTKRLLTQLEEQLVEDEESHSATLIAEMRVGRSGQNRMNRFLENRDDDNESTDS